MRISHHVEISDEALISAVELSSRYVTDRFMPDKAIDLIDEAASMANVELWKRSEEEEMLENEAVSLPSAVTGKMKLKKSSRNGRVFRLSASARRISRIF